MYLHLEQSNSQMCYYREYDQVDYFSWSLNGSLVLSQLGSKDQSPNKEDDEEQLEVQIPSLFLVLIAIVEANLNQEC